MTYTYTIEKRGRIEPGAKPDIAKDEEALTGFVQGKPASVPEERFYNGVVRTHKARWIRVQVNIGAPNTPGWKTLDSLVETLNGYHRAFEVDGAAFVHHGDSKKAEDRLSDLKRLTGLKKMGYRVREIEHISDVRLQTQDDANRRAKELMG